MKESNECQLKEVKAGVSEELHAGNDGVFVMSFRRTEILPVLGCEPDFDFNLSLLLSSLPHSPSMSFRPILQQVCLILVAF